MAADLDAVRRALRATMLADLPIMPVFGDSLLISGVDPAEMLPAWRTARAVMESTGRRPVFVDGDAPFLDEILQDSDSEDPPFDPSSDSSVAPSREVGSSREVAPSREVGPAREVGLSRETGEWKGPGNLTAMDQVARSIDPWQALHHSWRDEPLDDDTLRSQLAGFGHAPWAEGTGSRDAYPGFEVGEVRRRVSEPTLRTVNRYVFDRVRDDPALLAQVPPYSDRLTGLHQWYQPERVELLLPPTTEPHLLAGWVSFHGTLGAESVLAGALLQWHDRWQAELVAGWETMLQLVVGRRPEEPDDAFEVAYQIALLASHLEMTVWEIALAVTRGDEWFLHNRP
ncbi:hypothetical protein [Actinoplanes couchii]|nr:hypothetical protein [Actinoplanes couchii]MDR6321297.1 hypothetical protein [Actinoplanes couchii]